MQRYILRRILLFFPTLLLASLAIFGIMRLLPGDVVSTIVGGLDDENVIVTEQQIERLRTELGLNDPIYVQYGRWIWSMVNGEFGGRSLRDREPLATSIGRQFPVSLQLTLLTLVIAWGVSIPLGVVAAVKQNGLPDYLIRVLAIGGYALPNFWVALILLLVMLLVFSWTPPLIYVNVWEDPWGHLQKMIWPALILAWGFSGNLVRITRSNMLEVLRQDYVRTARSKGLPEHLILSRHALRNAFIPVLTLGALQVGTLLSGTVILENVFSLPGLGQAVVRAANERDYPVIQSLTMMFVIIMLVVNLVVDLIYSAVDPRIRYS